MGAPAFAPSGSSVSVLCTSTVAGISTAQIQGLTTLEIANVSATIGATVFITQPYGTTAGTSASNPGRVVPPMGVIYQRLPNGCSHVSAIASAAAGGSAQVVFTPGSFLPQGDG